MPDFSKPGDKRGSLIHIRPDFTPVDVTAAKAALLISVDQSGSGRQICLTSFGADGSLYCNQPIQDRTRVPDLVQAFLDEVWPYYVADSSGSQPPSTNR